MKSWDKHIGGMDVVCDGLLCLWVLIKLKIAKDLDFFEILGQAQRGIDVVWDGWLCLWVLIKI